MTYDNVDTTPPASTPPATTPPGSTPPGTTPPSATPPPSIPPEEPAEGGGMGMIVGIIVVLLLVGLLVYFLFFNGDDGTPTESIAPGAEHGASGERRAARREHGAG